MPTAIKAQLQQEDILDSHHGCTLSTQLESQGRLCLWTLQDTYYIRPLYQAWEIWQLYLIYRNKCREFTKMRRQRNRAQMKKQNKTPEKELNKMETSFYYMQSSTHLLYGCSMNLVRTSAKH